MLGEQIGESQGKVTSQRVLPGDDFRYLKMELTFQESGKMFGMPVNGMGTYTIFERIPGQMYGEGQGMFMTADGESAMWNGHGVAHPTGQGMGISVRFSLAVQAQKTGNLGRLNDVLVIGEHESDADGNTRTRVWEWEWK